MGVGLTIDYGPFAFLEKFDPSFTPNTTDSSRRYCYANQPHIGLWNCERFATAALGVLEGDKEAQSAVFQEACRTYIEAFQSDWHERMRKKLGLKTWKASTSEDDEASSDEGMMKRMFSAMGEVQVDFTNFFRSLAKIDSTTN